MGDQAIVEAVEAMTHWDGEPLEEYWARAKQNPLARLVKLCDLQHNSSPERLRPDNPDNRRRAEKYRRAHEFLHY